MSPERIRIKLAEAMGEKLFFIRKPMHDPFGYYRENAKGYTCNLAEAWRVTEEVGRRHTYLTDRKPGDPGYGDRVVLEPVPVPNYPDDLNAAFEVIKWLHKTHGGYSDIVGDGVKPWTVMLDMLDDEGYEAQNQSLALAICEAALRALDLWEE